MDEMYDSVIELPAEVELPKDEASEETNEDSHPIENDKPIEPVMSLQEQHSFGTLVDRYKRKRTTPVSNPVQSNYPMRSNDESRVVTQDFINEARLNVTNTRDERSYSNDDDHRRVVNNTREDRNDNRNKPIHVKKPFAKNKHSFHSKRARREEQDEPKKSFSTKHAREEKTFHKPKQDRGPIACVFSRNAANYLRDIQEMDEITSAWHNPEGLLAYMRTFKNTKSIFLYNPTDAQLNALARYGYKAYCLQ